jgi:hypothetical protein
MRLHTFLAMLVLLAACTPAVVDSPIVTAPPVDLPFAVSDQNEPAPMDEATVDYNCTDQNPHLIGQGIAAKYDASYQQVMTWFCSGYSFENIMIALETSDAVEIPADTLLEMRLEKEWEEIWSEIGLTNNP